MQGGALHADEFGGPGDVPAESVDLRDEVFPFGESLLSKYWLEACRALSIPDLHWHDLRHEAASRLIEAGWSAHEVRVVTGHASSQHLDRYINLDPEDVARKAVK